MNAALQTPFNSAQVEILKLFSQGLTEEQTEELRRVLTAFKFRLLDEHLEKVVSEKGMSVEEIDMVSEGHRRTPYQKKQSHNESKP